MEYREGQTPEERLRNYLSPFFNLANIVKSTDMNDLCENSDLFDLIKKTAETCENNQEAIRNYLHDISIFYKK